MSNAPESTSPSRAESAEVAGSRTPRLGRRDALATALLALAWGAVYAATLRTKLIGDGVALLRSVLYEPDDFLWVHIAYVPFAKAFASATAFDTTADALLWFSVLTAALGVALVYPLARAFDARPLAAVFATCLVAAAPAQWFWSTTIEVHTLHVLAVTATALSTVLLPWRRLPVALPIAALLSLSLHLSHQSGVLLQPAFLLLAIVAHERATAARASRRLVAIAFLPAYVAAGLAAVAIGRLLQGGAGLGSTDSMLEFFLDNRQPLDWNLVWQLWGWPLGLVWIAPLLVVLARSSRTAIGVGGVAALASLPFLVFFTWFGYPERGAYALGFLPFWAVAAGVALDRLALAPRASAATIGAVLTVQVAVGLATTIDPQEASWLEGYRSRCEFIDGLHDGPTFVLSFDVSAQTIESLTDGVREVDLFGGLQWAATNGAPDQQILALWNSIVAAALAVPDAYVLFDLGHRGQLDGSPMARVAEFIEAHTRAARLEEVLEHDGVEYWRLGRRRP